MDFIFTDFVNNLIQKRTGLINLINPLSEKILKYKKSQDVWSVSEILHHVYLSEVLINNLLDKLLIKYNITNSNLNLEKFKSENKLLYDSTDENILSVAQAKGTEPEINKTKDELFSLLDLSRKRTENQIEISKKNDLSNVTFTHFRLGILNFYEWILFIYKHECAHISQIRNILNNSE
jgi:hypothetical protein